MTKEEFDKIMHRFDVIETEINLSSKLSCIGITLSLGIAYAGLFFATNYNMAYAGAGGVMLILSFYFMFKYAKKEKEYKTELNGRYKEIQNKYKKK